jgi:cytochrome c oxidase assembly protein subunit 11
MASMQQPAIAKTVSKLLIVAVAMFAFVFVVMVPLYNVLCDVLGINGKTSGARYEVVQAAVDTEREVEVQFIAMNNDGMPWIFRPTTTSIKVNPGAINNTQFYAKNPLAKPMIAQAIPSVSPARAAEYFHKTECFCFNNQPLDAGSETEMGLQFIIDQDLPKEIKTVTLSYTMFDVTDLVADNQQTVSAR